VKAMPTRWRTVCEDQLGDAEQRVAQAEHRLGTGGGPALQAAYQAVVAAASVRVWLTDPPWQRMLDAGEMQRRAQAEFPSLFAALAALDVKQALTSAWTPEAAAPYVAEARHYVADTKELFAEWRVQE
jgi:hypothetical protein